jgi:multidrug transporter EmrE-like cation transporter
VKDYTGPARAALTQKLQFTSLRFFATAAVSMFEFWLYKDGFTAMGWIALATAIAMGVAGVFAMKLSRTAFFAATMVYGLGSAVLLSQAVCKHCPLFLAQPMLIHAVVMRGMMQAYGKMDELHSLENL